MKRGDFETRMQLTAWVYIRPAGETGHIDLGDLAGHTVAYNREGAELLAREPGHHRRIGNLSGVVGLGWEFDLREQFDEIMPLLLAGESGADVTSVGGSAVALETILANVKQGRSYQVGYLNLNIVTVEYDSAVMTEGVDYTVDYGSGLIYIVPGGGIPNGATVDAGFSQFTTKPGNIVHRVTTALAKARRLIGDVELHEKDQHASNGTPRRIWKCTGQYYVDAGVSHDGKKPAEPKLKIMPVTRPTLAQLK